MSKGAGVVTDGLLHGSLLRHNGRPAHAGDLLTISDGGQVVLKVETHTTAELGAVEKVEVVICSRDPESQASSARRGAAASWIDGGPLVAGWWGGDRFRCFTNPI